ncbi:MAG: hypothetical protein FWC53_01915 [Firmicutes bacterium]|nr:hypothetical protein [Bacillota bacterium]
MRGKLVRIEYQGEQLTIGAIARRNRIDVGSLRRYYAKLGDINEAVKQTKSNSRANLVKIEYEGEQLTMTAIARRNGIYAGALKRHYDELGDIYEAIKQAKGTSLRGKSMQIDYHGGRLSMRAIARKERTLCSNINR